MRLREVEVNHQRLKHMARSRERLEVEHGQVSRTFRGRTTGPPSRSRASCASFRRPCWPTEIKRKTGQNTVEIWNSGSAIILDFRRDLKSGGPTIWNLRKWLLFSLYHHKSGQKVWISNGQEQSYKPNIWKQVHIQQVQTLNVCRL